MTELIKNTNGLTLALETAVLGGSIGIYSDGSELASICGSDNISRAETLLPNISSMLKAASVEKREIHRIVVSVGPGSYTGIRIGISTALGLKTSLGIECFGVSVLTAMTILAKEQESCLIAVPVGKKDVGYQFFSYDEKKGWIARSDPAVTDRSQTASLCIDGLSDSVIFHPSLFEDSDTIEMLQKHNIALIDAGQNISRLIADPRVAGHWSDDISPIYVLNPSRQNNFLPV